MHESFQQALLDFEQSEKKLNSRRHQLFSECGRNLFFSDGFDAYEESLEQYFFTLHSKFSDEKYLSKIAEGLCSTDANLRGTILRVIKSGFFRGDFLSNIASSLLHLAIDGNDEDRVLTIKIFSRKYPDKAALIAALPDCLNYFYKGLEAETPDSYYNYQNIGRVLRELGATDFVSEYIRIGQNSTNADIRELAGEFASIL